MRFDRAIVVLSNFDHLLYVWSFSYQMRSLLSHTKEMRQLNKRWKRERNERRKNFYKVFFSRKRNVWKPSYLLLLIIFLPHFKINIEEQNQTGKDRQLTYRFFSSNFLILFYTFGRYVLVRIFLILVMWVFFCLFFLHEYSLCIVYFI